MVIRLRVAQFGRKGPRNFKLASRYVLLSVLLPLLIIIIHLPSILSLLQCARTLILKGISFYITKCDQYYYKMRLPFLSQSAMSISMKCNSFFTSKCESQVLLQSALVFFIKKCDVKCYFKCAWYLSATIVQSTKEQTKGFGHSSLHSHFFPSIFSFYI